MIWFFGVGKPYSTVTDWSFPTPSGKFVPFLTFIYQCITNRFVYHKKELIESGEYKDFDIILPEKQIISHQPNSKVK